jgi:hypothetical protein
VVLRATDADGEKWAAEVTAVCEPKAPLEKVWGRGRVRELEDRYAVQAAARAQLEREIVATSLSCGVLSRFTAYVAVDRAEVVNPGSDGKKVTQAVEAPAGWGQAEAMAAQAAPPAAAGSRTLCGGLDVRAAREEAAGGGRGGYGGGGGRNFGVPSRASAPRQPAHGSPPPVPCAPAGAADESMDCDEEEGSDRSRGVGGPRAAKKTLLAKQALREQDAGGRVSKKTQLATGGEKAEDAAPTLWQRVKEFFGAGERKQADVAPDVQALRTRAEALRGRLEGADGDETRLAALRATQTELHELVRDLIQAGDESAAVAKLANHVKNVAQLLAAPTPADELVRESHAGIVAALREWLGASGGGGGREFWK